MRQRIKRACVASSSNYAQSKKAHRAYLKEQHEKNNIILMTIAARPVKPKTDLELFEEGLKKQISLFKEKKSCSMKKFVGFIAVCGVLYAICGGENPFIYLLTVFCGVLYLFYPSEWWKE